MLLDFEVFKEKKNETGVPYLYLLKSDSHKETFCIVKVENDVPSLVGSTFQKTSKEIGEEDWETLSSRKKEIIDFLLNNMDASELVDLDNNFYQPELETNLFDNQDE